MTSKAICINCNTKLTGKYCSECGQKAHTGRLTLHELFHELWHALTHTDKGILKLIKDLTIHPRQVYQGYIDGQHKKYFSPVLFFLVTAGLVALFYPYIFDYQDKVNNMRDEFGREIFHITKYRALVLLPIETLLTWLFFHKRYNVAETAVFFLFCIGFTYVIWLVCIPVYFPLIQHKHDIDNTLFYVSYLIVFIHASLVFARPKIWRILLLFVLVNCFMIIDGSLQLLWINEHFNVHAADFSRPFEVLEKIYIW